MSILNFKEIPEAHKAGGAQDTFELFARDFFQTLGYRVDSAPGRGADGGKDLIIIETRKGIANNTEVRWLVSCKHKAHSGNSVSKGDEPEIIDSLRAHGCEGFIGFYSTLPSSGLVAKVEGMKDIEHQFFDYSKIEQILLSKGKFVGLAKRYFSESFRNWSDENPGVAQIFSDHEPFQCIKCHAALGNGNRGLVVSWQKFSDNAEGDSVKLIREYYACCGGECDKRLSEEYFTDGYVDAWAELKDYMNPTLYIKEVMAFCNDVSDPGVVFSEQAFEQKKEILIKVFPYVCRNLTKNEVARVELLGMVPSYLGGL